MALGKWFRAGVFVLVTLLTVSACTGSNSTGSAGSTSLQLPISDTDGSGGSAAAEPVTAAVPLPPGMSSAGTVRTATATISANGLSATLKGGGELTAQPVTLSPAAGAQLRLYTSSYGAAFDAAVQIAADPAATSHGLKLVKTLSSPLPAKSRAVLMAWDDRLGGWRALPTAVSTDRKTLTATVKQSGVITDAVMPVGEWLSRSGGTVFATHADAPSCVGQVPSWVHTHTFVADAGSTVLWCVGQDARNAKLLSVKVRTNRGYGVVVTTKTPPQSSSSDYLSGNALSLNTNLASELGASAAASLNHFLSGGQIVPGGHEVDFTFTESQVRTAGSSSKALVTALSPTGLSLNTSLMLPLIPALGANAAGSHDQGSPSAYAAALFTAANCGKVLTAVTGTGSGGQAVQSCLSALGTQPPAEIAAALTRSKLNGQQSPDSLTQEVAADLQNIQRLAAAGVGFQLADQASALGFSTTSGQLLVTPVSELLLGQHAVGKLRLGTTLAGAQKMFPDLQVSATTSGCQKATDRQFTLFFAGSSDAVSAGRLVYIAINAGTEYAAVGFAPGDPLSKAKAKYGAAAAGPGSSLIFPTGAGKAVYQLTTTGRSTNAKGPAPLPFSPAEYEKQTISSIALAGPGQTCSS